MRYYCYKTSESVLPIYVGNVKNMKCHFTMHFELVKKLQNGGMVGVMTKTSEMASLLDQGKH